MTAPNGPHEHGLSVAGIRFQWDQDKARRNQQKHSVEFEEAATTFADPFSIDKEDVQHSLEEQRWAHIGLSSRGRVLVAIWSERTPYLRIIRARVATTSERKAYEENS